MDRTASHLLFICVLTSPMSSCITSSVVIAYLMSSRVALKGLGVFPRRICIPVSYASLIPANPEKYIGNEDRKLVYPRRVLLLDSPARVLLENGHEMRSTTATAV